MKLVKYKLYENLFLLPVLDFFTILKIYINLKNKTDNFILVIVDQCIRIVNYRPVLVSINNLGLIKVIINIVMQHSLLLMSLLINKGLVFTLKSWLLLHYFLLIKLKLN